MISRRPLAFAAIALCATWSAGIADKPPSIPVAPGTPTCSGTDPLVCTWTTDGLAPAPGKFALQAIAYYDLDGDGAVDASRQFSFTTPDATPSISIPASALVGVFCVSQDQPCTSDAAYGAQDVQIRVKALNPPAKNPNGSQRNPFSDWSGAVVISTAGPLLSDGFESPPF